MPIYEYLCDQCGTLIEKIQKFSDPPLTHCEKCEGKLAKVLSQSSFVLKGAGWYLSDYSKKPCAATPQSESKSESKSDTKMEPAVGCGSGACGVKAD
jgi:putative FmdB family regulatory protein